MTFYEQYRTLCAERGIRPTGVTMTKALNTSSARISSWKSGNRIPEAEMLCKIADFFDVSVDFLLGREDNRNTVSLSDQEMELIKIFRSASAAEQVQIVFTCGQLIKKESAESITLERIEA